MITYPIEEMSGVGRTISPKSIPGLGWVLVKDTSFGGFRIIALADHGKGFKTRDEARKAKAELAQ
jgi:hypothetical protein